METQGGMGGPSCQSLSTCPGTHVGKEREVEILPQVPHGAATPVLKDVQVCLPFVLWEKRGS